MARGNQKSRAGNGTGKRRTRKSPPKKAVRAAGKNKELQRDPAPSQAGNALILPESLDSASAGSIKDLLLARRGSSLVVDAGQVRRTGVQAVQILIAAARTWQADGQEYVVTNATGEFLETLSLVGLSREHLLVEGYSV